MLLQKSYSPILDEPTVTNTDTSDIYLYRQINSPIGPLTLTASDRALIGLDWGKSSAVTSSNTGNNAILDAAESQLREYFSGTRQSFDLPLAPQGTEFQKRVWRELINIPYGECISYGELARRIGNPKACRAVGGANGRNPIGIIIPCHRVIGASGALTGFTGGLDIKKMLLKLEGYPS